MINRRHLLLSGLYAGAAALSTRAWADTSRLIVMTSYPQEVISRYLDAFAKVAPNTRVDVVWHSGDDARDYLLGPGRDKVDVYWSPSVRTFHELAEKDAFLKLSVDRTSLPGKIGKQTISDPNGYYEAVEIAGYGFVYNPDYLQKRGLAIPHDWTDLAKPAYAGHVTMPVPSHIGFAPTITEIILQSYGWQAGWSLLSQIAANAQLQAGRGDETMGEVTRGEKGIALTIDFFASQAIAQGAPLGFYYPTANAFEPANIAIPKGAPNLSGAKEYVKFVLSDAGQRLLLYPDMRRLAVRPSVYKDAPEDYFNPWTAEFTKELSFDNTVFIQRRDLDNALFDVLIYEPRARLDPLWATIHRLDQTPGTSPATRQKLAQARMLLGTAPLSEQDAAALCAAFMGRRRGNDKRPLEDHPQEARWRQTVAQNIDKAQALLADIHDVSVTP